MKGVKKYRSFLILVIALVLCYGAGFLGSLFIIGETNGDWYASVRPSITPPNWLFPIVWNILFLLIAVSFWLTWIGSTNDKDRKKIVWVYGINLVANVLWSAFYFGLHNPSLAFVDLILIVSTIIVAMVISRRIDKRASLLLMPYLIWVIFAGLLNFLSIS